MDEEKTLEQQIAEIRETMNARITELETQNASLQDKLKDRENVISKFLTDPGRTPGSDNPGQDDHTDDVKDILSIIKRRRS